MTASDTLKVHVRGVGPRVTASLMVGRVKRNTSSEYRRADAGELVYGVAASELQGQNVTVYLENYSVLGLQYTVLVHVHRLDQALAPRDGRLLAELGSQCCRPRTVAAGVWCSRLSAAALISARGGVARDPSAAGDPPADFCSWPETLCSQASGAEAGSLQKLSLPGGLDCGGAAGAVAALAGATSLAWLDLSRSSLGLQLSDLAGLMASPSLQRVVLTEAGLRGPLSYFNDTRSSNSSSGGDGGAIANATATATVASVNASDWGAAACGGLAPAGRRVMALSGNSLLGGVPECLAAHPGLVELQLQGNADLTSIPSNWSRAALLRHLDLSAIPTLRGPLAALPPTLVHLNASGTALGGGVPSLPPTLLTLDLLAAGLVGSIAGAASPPALVALPPALPSASSPGPSGGAGTGGGGGGEALVGVAAAGSRGWVDSPGLAYVDVGSNVLRGGVPELPSSLLVLYLDNNALSGPLPAALPPSLIILNASSNALSGQLPRTQLDAARFLDLSRNRFSGGLPSSIAGSSQLIYFNASFNNISGSLALFAFKLRSGPNSLQVLDLSHNSLNGPVPSYMSQLAVFSVQGALPSFPRVLDLSNNRLAGSVPDFVYRMLPAVVWSCRCLLLLSFVGSGNVLTCPLSAPSLDSTSLYILWLYQLNCVDGQTNITYSLAQWLTPGFKRLTLPDPSSSSSNATASTGGAGNSGSRGPSRADGIAACIDGTPMPAAGSSVDASIVCAYGPDPWARAGLGGVPEALQPYGWKQVLSMAQVPSTPDEAMLPLRLKGDDADVPWPIANILTIVLASLTAAIVLLIVVYICVRTCTVRRARTRRRARRRDMRQARLTGQRQALWADRMADMEREAAQQRQEEERHLPGGSEASARRRGHASTSTAPTAASGAALEGESWRSLGGDADGSGSEAGDVGVLMAAEEPGYGRVGTGAAAGQPHIELELQQLPPRSVAGMLTAAPGAGAVADATAAVTPSVAATAAATPSTAAAAAAIAPSAASSAAAATPSVAAVPQQLQARGATLAAAGTEPPPSPRQRLQPLQHLHPPQARCGGSPGVTAGSVLTAEWARQVPAATVAVEAQAVVGPEAVGLVFQAQWEDLGPRRKSSPRHAHNGASTPGGAGAAVTPNPNPTQSSPLGRASASVPGPAPMLDGGAGGAQVGGGSLSVALTPAPAAATAAPA